MGKVFVAAVALSAVALLYPTPSRADIGQREVRLEAISLDPDQASSSDGTTTTTINCGIISDCQAIPVDPIDGAHNPAIVFKMIADDTVRVHADIWGTLGCNPPDSPDAQVTGDLVQRRGANRIRIVFNPPLDDGTPLSIRWSFTSSDGTACPVTRCQDYASLGTPPPNLCPIQ